VHFEVKFPYADTRTVLYEQISDYFSTRAI